VGRIVGKRSPDLLAIDDVVIIAFAPCSRAQGKRIGAGGRLGDAERLQTQLAARDQRQVAFFLRVAAMPQNRAHRVHLRVTGGAIATGGVHFLENCRGRTQVETAASVFLGDQRRQVAGLRERSDELGRISPFTIKTPPILTGKLRAERARPGDHQRRDALAPDPRVGEAAAARQRRR